MILEIDSDEANLIKIAMNIRASIIETGSPILRATDAIESGNFKIVRPLAMSQVEIIAKMDSLVEKIKKAENGL